MLQQWIVAAIVVCAFWAVAKRYLPKALRQALRRGTVRSLRAVGWTRLADHLEAQADSGGSCGDGCGSCGGCGPTEQKESTKQFSISVEALRQTAHR